MMLAALLAPIPAITKAMKDRVTPFRAVVNGIVAGGVAAVGVMVIAEFAGSNVFDEMYAQIDAMAQIMAQDPNMVQLLGEGVSENERIKFITTIYSEAIKMIPSVVCIMAAVVSYVDYIILSKIYKPGGIVAIPMTKLREFNLPRNFATIWLITYLLLLLFTNSDAGAGNMIFMNISSLFDFVFCIQGLSVVFMFCYSKSWPKVLAVIVSVAALVFGLGQTLLILLGFTDILFGLKYRMAKKAA